MGLKKCSKCQKEYPTTTEYFYKNKRTKDGLNYICKNCRKIECAKEYKRNKEKRLEKGKEYYNKNKTNIMSRIKKYKTEHPEYWAKQKEYANKNKEKIKIRLKKWYKENKERINNNGKKYYKGNKELYKKLNHKNYIENKDKYNIRSEIRRTLLLKNIATLTLDDWNECLKFFDYKDAYTGLPMRIISQDHIVPLSKGGAYTKQNIVPCENSINISKHNNNMETWYKNQTFFSDERLQKIYDWSNVVSNKQQLRFI